MANSNLKHKITVDDIPYSTSGDIRINVKRRRADIYHSTLSNNGRVNISYLISEETNVNDNISIIDRSSYLPENATASFSFSPTTISGSVFTTFTEQFSITNVFTSGVATQPKTPLFYKHKFVGYNPDLSDWDSRSIKSIDFTDYILNKVDTSEYSIDETNGYIYNNFENSYDSSNQDFDIYYVKYAVEVGSGSSTTVETYHELLSNSNIFEEADTGDIDEFGNLLTTSTAYLKETSPDYSNFSITLPVATDDYAYKELAPNRLYIKEPVADSLEDPWYLRINNGKFISSVKTGNDVNTSLKYEIAEFNTQTFDPYYPYKFIQEENANHLYENIIKVSRNIVDNIDQNFTVNVWVYDEGGDTLQYAYTNDTDQIGSYVSSSSTVSWEDKILSIDEVSGFIELDKRLVVDDHAIYVDYYTESTDYDFTQVDFNPINNINILNQRIVIYVAPQSTTTGALSSTLYYLTVDDEGKIIYCSQADTNSSVFDVATSKLLNEDFTTNGIPTHTFYYDKPSTGSGWYWRTSGEHNNTAAQTDFSFIDKYTVENGIVLHSGISGEWLLNLQENPQFLVLGDITVGEVVMPSTATTLDIRVKGGGIHPDYYDAAAAIQPEVIWYGNKSVHYPGKMALYLEYPKSLLTENGGDWTWQQIQDLSTKHMVHGVYPVVRDYGNIEPVIVSGSASSFTLSGTLQSGMVTINWPSYGSGTTYDAYYSTDYDGTYNKHNYHDIDDIAAVPNGSLTNEYTYGNLNFNQTYYVYIEATRDGESNTSSIVSIYTGTADTD